MSSEQKRTGMTVVTSVSISKEYQKLIEQYKLSPTEVFRRGVAVMLCDLGVPDKVTVTNIQRSAKSKELLKSIREIDEINEVLQKKQDQLNKIKEILKDD